VVEEDVVHERNCPLGIRSPFAEDRERRENGEAADSWRRNDPGLDSSGTSGPPGP